MLFIVALLSFVHHIYVRWDLIWKNVWKIMFDSKMNPDSSVHFFIYLHFFKTKLRISLSFKEQNNLEIGFACFLHKGHTWKPILRYLYFSKTVVIVNMHLVQYEFILFTISTEYTKKKFDGSKQTLKHKKVT